MNVQEWAGETFAEATGQQRRADPVLPRGGGPAGNARLTAWTGVLLLALFLAELVTLLNLDGLISWHIVIGVLLVPPALLKTATTGWRVIGYYTRRPAYRQAGPPPMLLRLLGPLVVVGTLAVLGSGLALIALGPVSSRTVLFSVVGQDIDAVSIHQATFLAWAVVTGLHVLARLVPAMRIVTSSRDGGQRVPGRPSRAVVLLASMVVAVVAGAVLLGASGAWVSGGLHHGHHAAPSRSRSG
ncbi:hypothetical protein QRX60_31040 [Amycolatopsis mongoliensis]|uniref:Uncharacterized protein n=1 Tax=Amycolatopsis mongoliensis TaxID=715475 RepID=A0A9Y2JH99_9PSEU|nr:hypothetical protein [Amycolatopsis sp. 4-36]WIX98489.1 hypothetical protein QRX60_31040 [Amycolatopsis sp. 4-36]